MFLGHFAVGLALKRAAPRTSLGVLIAAPQLLDFLWPWFLLLGWEQVRIEPGRTAFTPLAFDSYPLSHSLLMAVVWGVVFAAVFARSGALAWWLMAAVVSHWVLDWITHAPDLPLTPWSDQKFGLGMWNSVPLTIMVEVLMFGGALLLYQRTTRPAGVPWRLYIFAAVLAAIYAGNVLGPPPPDERSLALVAAGLWVFAIWAAWVDRAGTARA